MEKPMSNWNDDRLDELSRRMDDGFKEMREGFARMDERFDRLQNTLIRASVGFAVAFAIALLGLSLGAT